MKMGDDQKLESVCGGGKKCAPELGGKLEMLPFVAGRSSKVS